MRFSTPSDFKLFPQLHTEAKFDHFRFRTPVSAATEEILTDMTAKGFQDRAVGQLKARDKRPLPPFLLTMEDNVNQGAG